MRNPVSKDSPSSSIAFLADQETQSHVPGTPNEVRAVMKVSAIALAGFALIYFCLLVIDLRFPYLRPGDNLVAETKHRMARSGNAFQSQRGTRLHVMAFGYSKTLAGFIPAAFDSAMATSGFKVESYNFGLPGDSLFVDDLEAMAAHGTAPDIALLTFPWPANPDPRPNFFHFILDDQKVMDELFPFRHLPRDFLIAASEGHNIAGIEHVYRDSESAVQQVTVDRGYYFIARQSHYKNDELPPGLKLPNDTPGVVAPRDVTLGPVYEHLAAVLADHHVRCIFVPKYFRDGEFAPAAPINPQTAALVSSQPNLGIAGPDYVLYPNRDFSDPVHANRRGAAEYTQDLAALLAGWLKQHKQAPE